MALLWKGSGACGHLDAYREALRNAKIVAMVFGIQREEGTTTAWARDSIPKGDLDCNSDNSPNATPKKNPRKAVDRIRALEDISTARHNRAPTWGKKPRCNLPRPQVPRLQGFFKLTPHARRRRRPASCLPMLKDGQMVVPPPALSGYKEIDEKNHTLAKTYTKITDILGKHQAEAIAGSLANANYVKEVRQLREEAFEIRRTIQYMFGVPLSEPVLYWRWRYHLAPF